MKQDLRSFVVDRAAPLAPALDYGSLVAALSAHQATTRTARVARRLGGIDHPSPAQTDALADLVTGQAGWTAAVTRLAGRFHALAAVPSEPAAGRPDSEEEDHRQP